VDSWQDFFSGAKADVLVTTAEEGSTMTLHHPLYHVVVPKPGSIYKILYAHPVSKNSDDSSLMVINYWLLDEAEEGDLSAKHDYWILGKNAEKKTPRWSVTKDVLHWIN